MTETHKLLTEIAYLTRLISTQKNIKTEAESEGLGSDSIDKEIESAIPINQATAVRTESQKSGKLKSKCSSSSSSSIAFRSNFEASEKKNRYAWTSSSTEALSTTKDELRSPMSEHSKRLYKSSSPKANFRVTSLNSLQSGIASQKQALKSLKPKTNRNDRGTFQNVGIRPDMAIKSNMCQSNDVAKEDIQVQLETNDNVLKGAAVNFLKEKVGARKVFINKDHALFKNSKLPSSDLKNVNRQQQELQRVQKHTAIDFFEQVNVETSKADPQKNRASMAGSYNHITVGKDSTLNTDHKLIKDEERDTTLRPVISSSSFKALPCSRYKLVRKKAPCYRNSKFKRLSTGSTLKSETCQSEGTSGNKYTPIRCSNSSSTPFFKVGKYKLVKNRAAIPLQGLSACAPKGSLKSKCKKIEQNNQKRLSTPFTCGLKQQGNSRYKFVNLGIAGNCKGTTNSAQAGTVSGAVKATSGLRTAALSVANSPKTKSRFKLVRKALPTGQRKFSTAEVKHEFNRNTKCKYKLVNTKRRQSHERESLVWSNRFSLKRDNSKASHIITANRFLGRRVTNLSKNRYKFVSSVSKQPNRKDLSQLPAIVLERKFRPNKFKIDRRTSRSLVTHTKSSSVEANKARVVMLGGILYKSSKSHFVKITQDKNRRSLNGSRYSKSPVYFRNNFRRPKMQAVIVRGIKYKVDPTGRTLHRVSAPDNEKKTIRRLDIGGVTYLQTRPGTLVKASTRVKRVIASRSIHKSIARSTAVNKKSQKKYCMFYNRFGKCNKKEACRFVHDPDKIAVCTRFLRGTCKVSNCPFSHKLAKDKMPVCLHYLRGACSRDQCPYRHVKVSKDAEICPDFLKGYCPEGNMCNKQHTLVCLEYIETGKCPQEAECKLYHPKKPSKRKKIQEEVAGRSEGLLKKNIKSPEVNNDDKDEPMRKRHLPSFISLSSDVVENRLASGAEVAKIETAEKAPLKIRPAFK